MRRASALFRRKNKQRHDGGKDRESSSKSKSDAPSQDALDNLVEVYLADDMIDIPLVPEFVERRVYKTILKTSLETLREKLKSSEETCAPRIFGHTVRFEMSPAVDQMVGSVKEAHTLVNRDEKQRAEHKRVTDEFVQRFLDNEDIGIFVIPDAVERRVYANVIKMAVGITQDMLHTSKVGFLGHELHFRLVPRPDSISPGSKTAEKTENTRRPDSTANQEQEQERVIADFVDEKLRHSNIWLLPDAIERRIYIKAFRLLLAVLEEVLRTCEISVLNHSIRLRLDR